MVIARPLSLALLLAACAPPALDTGEDAPACDVAPPEVARVDVATGYRTLDAPVDAPWLAAPRTVPVGIWYPTDATDGDPATYIETFVDESSWVDAPFADPTPGCRLPLVVYSHGSQAWGGNTSPLLRHLVAQGWVAAAPDHVGNTLIDNDEPRPVSYSRTRVADIVATLDALDALPEGDPLHDRVDTSRVLVLGHSFGGQTAWLLAGPTFDTAAIAERCDAGEPGCSDVERAAYDAPVSDPRVVAVLPLDGFAGDDLVAVEGWATADRPILYLSQAGDGDEGPFTTATAADVTWGRVEGACHETFTNSPLLCDTFDKEEGLTVTAAYLTAFAAKQVLGLDTAPYAGILDGSTVVDDRVTIRRTRE
jgi:pimeloyl-ACP methyl ester carboxylesterase